MKNFKNMRKLFISMIMLCAMFSAQAQLKVASNGRVQIPNIVDVTGSGTILNLDPTNTHTAIGSSLDKIDFWYTGVNFNQLVASSYSTISDRSLKTNILPMEDALNILNTIKTYTYNYVEQEERETRKHYGVIAQELQDILPELVGSSHDYLTVNYDEFIPMLINAIQDLNRQVADLREELKNEKSNNKSGSSPSGGTSEMILYQNAPNPFSATTTVRCYIPKTIRNAQLCIYNMQGVQVKCVQIGEREETSVSIQAGQLSAGIYTYLIIGDGKASEAKQMVLTN
jgi:hypothetical protein